jgi:hypothetical protein
MAQTLNSNFQSPNELQATPGRSDASSVKLPLILVLIALSMFLPEETSFFFGGLRLTICRLILLLIAPVVLLRFAQMTIHVNYRFVWSDVLVPVTGLWMFVGPIAINGLERALVYSGILALQFCIPYMAARVFLTERGQAVKLVRILCIAITTVGVLAIFDELSRRFLIREIVGSLTGYSEGTGADYTDVMRGFLFRATSTLEHPILLGTACMCGLLMATTMRGALRLFMLVGSALGLLLSVSSAAISGAIVGFAALLYNKIMRNFSFRWGLVLASAVVVATTLFSIHPDPLGFILNHVTIDRETAYYRVLQWQYAGPLIMNSPILGVGAADEEWTNKFARSSGLAKTIDATWLLMALQFGLPGSILIFLSYITPCSLSTDIGNENLNLTKQERQLGFVLSLILGLVIYIGFTVYYWGSVYILITFLAGIRAHLGALGALPRESGLDDDG